MSEFPDLRSLLDAWPYDEHASTRIVQGTDGRQFLQVRTPLGMEQFELEGRPDGLRPYGSESVLQHHQDRLLIAFAKDTGETFRLSAEDCAELFREGTLYYLRYLHLFQLKDWTRTARDTQRNLELFDFVHKHAAREEDRMHLEKWRPYILRVNAIARAMIDLEHDSPEAAIVLLERTIARIEALAELDDEAFRFERGRSLGALHEVADRIRQTRPVSELQRLESELRQAIATEAFEQAALLRDRIRDLRSRNDRGES